MRELPPGRVLAGEATAQPQRTDSVIESTRLLMLARDSAVKARIAAMVQLQDMLITAPSQIREKVPSTGRAAATYCRKFRIDQTRLNDPVQAVKFALRTQATRIADLNTEITTLERSLAEQVQTTAPTLIRKSRHRYDPCCSAADHHRGEHRQIPKRGRLSEALRGCTRTRVLGERATGCDSTEAVTAKANRALHMIAMVRLRDDARTIEYMQRRLSEGLSKKTHSDASNASSTAKSSTT